MKRNIGNLLVSSSTTRPIFDFSTYYFKLQYHHFLAVKLWALCFTYLSLYFLLCVKGVIIVLMGFI